MRVQIFCTLPGFVMGQGTNTKNTEQYVPCAAFPCARTQSVVPIPGGRYLCDRPPGVVTQSDGLEDLGDDCTVKMRLQELCHQLRSPAAFSSKSDGQAWGPTVRLGGTGTSLMGTIWNLPQFLSKK